MRYPFGLNLAVLWLMCLGTHAVYAQASAKPLASCPAKPGKKLLTVRLEIMPGGQILDGDGDDSGTEWGKSYLSQVKSGQHIVLDCGYGAPKAPVNGAVTDHATVPVPPSATYCWSDNGDKVTGSCYLQKPTQ